MKNFFTVFTIFALSIHAQAQYIGIGTNTPLAKLHVHNGSVVFTGAPFLSYNGPYGNPPINGTGTRMMWYAEKAAFRVGQIFGDYWDNENVGLYSFATGIGTMAKGEASLGFGSTNKVTGDYSFVGGINSFATNRTTFAFGENAEASGYQSIAIGTNAKANAYLSFSVGSQTIANGLWSTCLGLETRTSADNTTAMGYGTIARSTYSLVAGKFNDTTATDCLFELGNGEADNARSNAFTILNNGYVGIGLTKPNAQLQLQNANGNRKIILHETANNNHQFYGFGVNSASLRYQVDNTAAQHAFYAATGGTTSSLLFSIRGDGNAFVSGTLSQASDARLKKNIEPITGSLNKLTQLNGYTYDWMSENKDQRKQIGLLAQEVQNLFPLLVTEIKNEDGQTTLGINYSGLIPVLIESIKEQKKEIEELKIMVKQLMKK